MEKQSVIFKGRKYQVNKKSGYYTGTFYLHRVVWESHNGEIPKGCHVHHKDGNKLNNDINNLELLTQKKHLSHTMTSRYGKDLVEKTCSICGSKYKKEKFLTHSKTCSKECAYKNQLLITQKSQLKKKIQKQG